MFANTQYILLLDKTTCWNCSDPSGCKEDVVGADQAVDAVYWTLDKLVQLDLVKNNSFSKYQNLESRFGVHFNEQTLSQEDPKACLLPLQILMTIQWN